VDFDQGLYNAIKRLREALGDTAETPRFIETLPKRGYRFIGVLDGKGVDLPPLDMHSAAETINSDAGDGRQTPVDIRLQTPALAAAGDASSPPIQKPTKRLASIWWGLAFVTAVLALLLGISYLQRKTQEAPSIRAEVSPQSEQRFGSFGLTNAGFAISPDGTKLVYGATQKGVSSLWVRKLDQVAAERLPDTDDGKFPFWSPDGTKIGFFARGKLRTLLLTSTAGLTICDAPDGRGGTWNRNGVIVFSPNIREPLYRVTDSGGTPEQLTALEDPHRVFSHRWPFFLPDGEHFLLMEVLSTSTSVMPSANGIGEGFIRVGSLSTRTTAVLLPVLSPAEFANGHVLYTRSDNVLVAQRFDPENLRLKGDPVPIAQNVLRIPNLFRTFFSVSKDGILMYAAGLETATPQSLVLRDRKGKKLAELAQGELIGSPRFSPDGQHILFDFRSAGNREIWVFDLQSRSKTQLTFSRDGANNSDAVWSPNGRQIAFAHYAPGKYSIHLQNTDGSGFEQTVTENDLLPLWPKDWSSNERFLIVTAGNFFVYDTIQVIDLKGDKKPFSVPSMGQSLARNGRLSPDGQWISYLALSPANVSQVFVGSFQTAGRRWQVSTDGGLSPAWRGDGRELYYLAPPDNSLIALELRKDGSDLEFGKPQKLFQLMTPYYGFPYDVSRDGQRFVSVEINSSPAPLILVTNWTLALQPK
jgi:Tol biopolymer transport system component